MFKLFIAVLLLLTFVGAGCAEVKEEKPQVKDANQITKPIIDEKKSMRNLPQHKDLAAEFNKAVLKTNKGDITVEFYGDLSPITVNNFLNLAQQGVFDNTKFHRVIKDFMIQGGDPNSKTDNVFSYGTGDPGYKFNDEFNSEKLVRGSLAMANSGPNTNGSQFFIVTAPSTPWLDGKHVNFGYVVGGLEIVDEIENSEIDARDLPVEAVIIESIKLIR